jgi:POT family proton-dependent oligopeptide transporter
MSEQETQEKKNPLREITQPFVDVVRAPRALWGINFPYLIEGMVYFGMLQYLAMYFNQYVGLDDVWAGRQVGVLTAGITISMFLFGGLADRWGVRVAIIAAFFLMVGGRVLLAAGPYLGLDAQGIMTPLNGMAMGGILLVVLGYGMYQPAAYAAVRQFTSEKTAAMGFAMLYALMNLGGWLPTFFTPIREAVGISGAYWVFVGFTVLALIISFLLLSRQTVQRAIATAKAEREREEQEKEAKQSGEGQETKDRPAGEDKAEKKPSASGIWNWLKNHPLANAKFAFFIFCLIPVQTLFAHNWLTLPMYVERAYRETWPWISINFEKAVNFNPLLIFILVPIVTAITQKRKVYNMMLLGTLVMSAPTFLLAIGATWWTLIGYLIIMTVGEAMWQPRFLQYAAEIAPEGRTGAYMGVAQFPWFLTKLIVPLYSGWFLARFCPMEGEVNSEAMWLIYAIIAISSTAMLLLAKNWLGKDFKTKAD